MLIATTLTPFVLFFFWLLFFQGGTVACGNCDAALPRFQSPLSKSKRQWWQGGATCGACGCDCDRHGNKIDERSDVSSTSKLKWLSLIAVAMVPAVAMLSFLLFSK